MSYRSYRYLTAIAALAVWTWAAPAQALTMKECSARYKAAQTAGTLNGQKWNDFRKAECGAEASATPTEVPAAPPAPAAKSTKTGTTKAGPAPMPSGAGEAVFPTAVSSKYSSESAGKSRMHTCLDQYNANKATNRNGGLAWIQKGGGYYSECNKRLKS